MIGISHLRFLPLLSLLCMMILATACNRNAPPSTEQSSRSSAPKAVKRYPFKGKVDSVDAQIKSATIANEDIPGFMGPMTMPYEIRPVSDLQKLRPGDTVIAEVVVDNSDSNNEKYWLEHVAVASSPQKPQ
jgi:protein SCO1